MSRPKNNTPLLAVVTAAALGGIAVLNRMQYENRPKTPQELQEEEEARKRGSAPAAPPSAPPTSGPDLQSVKPDFSVGEPTPEREVTLGYLLSPSVQGDPSGAVDALQHFSQMLEKVNNQMALRARFRLVNVDVVRDVPEGIWVDGHFVSTFNLGTLRSEGSHLVETIVREIKSSFPSSKKPSPVKK